MGMSGYVRGLREKIGTDFLLIPSTAAIVRDDRGRVLLVRHVEGRWQLPGGAIDPGESPQEAAARECMEEAGIEVRVGEVLGVFGGDAYRVTYANGDELGFVPIVFGAALVSGEPRPDQEETQEVGWFTLQEAAELEMHPATREMLVTASSRSARD